MTKAIFNPEEVQKLLDSVPSEGTMPTPENVGVFNLRKILHGSTVSSKSIALSERTFERYAALILGLIKPLLSSDTVPAELGVPGLLRAFPLTEKKKEELRNVLLAAPIIWDAVSGTRSMPREETVAFTYEFLGRIKENQTGLHGTLTQRDFLSFYLKELSFMENPKDREFYLTSFAQAFNTVTETLFQCGTRKKGRVRVGKINPLGLVEILITETIKKADKKKAKKF